jgi:hypothetical protein
MTSDDNKLTNVHYSHIHRFEETLQLKLDKIRQDLELSLQIYKSNMLSTLMNQDPSVQNLSGAKD